MTDTTTDTTEDPAGTTPEAPVGATESAESAESGTPDAGGDDAHADEHHGPTDAFFIKTALVLAVITALEVAASYVELGPLFLPILIGLMLVKFFAVV
ncbi:MAG: hypothetical protein AAGG08_17105, partial [Actinomycetota bacterium]